MNALEDLWNYAIDDDWGWTLVFAAGAAVVFLAMAGWKKTRQLADRLDSRIAAMTTTPPEPEPDTPEPDEPEPQPTS